MSTVEFRNIVKRYGALTVLEQSRSCGSRTASSWSSSARRAAARPRFSTSLPASSRSRKARSASTAATSPISIPRTAASPWSSSPMPSIRPRRCAGILSFGLSARKLSSDEIERAHRLGGEAPPDRPPPRTQAVAALRRPAPARRHRPRAGQAGRPLPLRRAAVEPRRQAPHRDAAWRSRSSTPSSGTPSSTSPTTRSRR